VQKAD